jgi:hypothetical protein
MKRIAAIAALVIISTLAVPVAAMAGTAGSGTGPGYARTGPARIVCLLPGQLRKGQVKIAIATKARLKAIEFLSRHKHGKQVLIRVGCPDWRPAPGSCLPQLLRFDMASGSSTLTEVSGPMLTPPEQFGYDGSTYTIMSVNPGADSFKVFVNGALFVNNGPAITDGTALMSCSG